MSCRTAAPIRQTEPNNSNSEGRDAGVLSWDRPFCALVGQRWRTLTPEAPDVRRPLPAALIAAKASGERMAAGYRVKRAERGWSLWRFFEWSSPHPGWRVVAGNLASEHDGQDLVLERLGLLEETSPKPVYIAAVIYTSEDWDRDLGGYDFSGM